MYLNEQTPPSGIKSIVSLVPSQTELLHYLGLEEEVVGITKFCVHPSEWFASKLKIGGTKTIDIEKIKSINPSLIIANKEENVQSQVEALSPIPVWLTDVNNLEEAMQMISDVGRITGKSEQATILNEKINHAFAAIPSISNPLRAAYLIWKEPYMTVGGDTFISDMLTHMGMRNVFSEKRRYPLVTVEELKNSGCEVLLLSSEPYPFKLKHIEELSSLLPEVIIKMVDGEMFSWYGSRLLKAATYLKNLQSKFLTDGAYRN